MSDQITYNDKADLIVDTTIDDMFKVSASDMNEIKSVVNANAQEMETNKAEVQDDIAVINNNINDLNNNKLDKNEVLNQASTDTDKPYSADYLNDKLVSVGVEKPTDGERVWFKKGKNKYNADSIRFGIISQTDGQTISSSTSVYHTPYIKVKPNTQYTLSYDGTNIIIIRLYNYTENRSFINTTILSGSGTSASFTTSATTNYMRLQFSTSITNKLQFEEGSTATTYEPYVTSTYVDDEEWYSKPIVLFEGTLLSGNTLSLDVSDYSKLEVTVQLAKIQGVLFIDLTTSNNGYTINDITYNYSASAVYGGIDEPKFINKCIVAVNNSLNTILAYNFGYADLSASSWTYTIRNNVNGWGIRKIVGYK